MVFDNCIAKGMKQVLIERQFDVTGLKKEDLKTVLKQQHTLLSDYIHSRGHLMKYEKGKIVEKKWKFS